MNALYAGTISTTSKTVFQSTDHVPAGFDIEGVTKFYFYNHDTANYLLVQEESMHIANAPSSPPGAVGGSDGWGALSGSAVEWLAVPPGGFVIISVAKDSPTRNSSLRKINVKSSSGTITFSCGVLERR